MRLTKIYDKEEFKRNLIDLGVYLDMHCPMFKKYFWSYYVDKDQYKCWSLLYRVNTLSTNNHLESFHKTLKHKYMSNKQYIRLDKFIKILEQITLDKFFKYQGSCLNLSTSKIMKNKIRACHVRSLKLKGITKLNDITLLIDKESNKTISYMIYKKQDCLNCSLKCPLCNTCPHLYTCSCEEYQIQNHCKHLHAAQLYFNPKKK